MRAVYSEEIAKAAVFLASDESSYVAGIELFVDGRAGPGLEVGAEINIAFKALRFLVTVEQLRLG
jgi:hypothetical protein